MSMISTQRERGYYADLDLNWKTPVSRKFLSNWSLFILILFSVSLQNIFRGFISTKENYVERGRKHFGNERICLHGTNSATTGKNYCRVDAICITSFASFSLLLILLDLDTRARWLVVGVKKMWSVF